MCIRKTISGRPGWITTEDFGLGMITNWGAHHVDIAQWAMGQELGGPRTIEAHAEFMTNDVWTVHTTYHVEMLYPDNVRVILDDKFANGIRFEGDEGWVFCTRGEEEVTASDPDTPAGREALLPLRASDQKILSPLDGNAVRWMPANRITATGWKASSPTASPSRPSSNPPAAWKPAPPRGSA